MPMVARMNENLVSAKLATTAMTRPRRRVAVSSSVTVGVAAMLDSFAIALAGIGSYLGIVGPAGSHLDYYVSAVCFIWLSVLFIFQFADLYEFDTVISPLRFIDKFIISFVTGFLFLLALGFTFKLSDNFSRIWVAAFAIGSTSSAFVLRLL